jgi:hypothetical protein
MVTIDAEPDAPHQAINMPLGAQARRVRRGAPASNACIDKSAENVSALKRSSEISA